MATCKLFFLIMAYSKLYNIPLWNKFLTNVPPSKYEMLIHSKLLVEVPNESSIFNITTIDKVESHYCKSSGVMNALFAAGLNKSYNDNDMFFIISSDAIPVKPFNEIYKNFCENGVRHLSQICIAPSNQWFPISKDSLVVKTFNWVTLTREDATRSVSSWRRHPRFLDFFAGYPDASNLDRGQCQEEYWFHSAIFGVFNISSAATATANTAGGGMLTYPSAMEQGRCFMYTWWEGYPPNSQFRADNIPELGYKHTKGAQTLISVPWEFYPRLRNSSGFYFARKIRSDIAGHGVISEESSLVMNLVTVVDRLGLYT